MDLGWALLCWGFLGFGGLREEPEQVGLPLLWLRVYVMAMLAASCFSCFSQGFCHVARAT